jgi:hypothetical protein
MRSTTSGGVASASLTNDSISYQDDGSISSLRRSARRRLRRRSFNVQKVQKFNDGQDEEGDNLERLNL